MKSHKVNLDRLMYEPIAGSSGEGGQDEFVKGRNDNNFEEPAWEEY